MLDGSLPRLETRDVSSCGVCGVGDLRSLIVLAGYPIAGLHASRVDTSRPWRSDQEVVRCDACDHVQLRRRLDREVLYGPHYGFHTGGSAHARTGAARLAAFARRVAPTAKTVLDIGCNDLTLLHLFRSEAETLVGIDPLWRSGRDPWYGTTVEEVSTGQVKVIGAFVEDVDLGAAVGRRPDLVLLRQTLEHLESPRETLARIADAMAEDAVVIVEVGLRDAMEATLRFDQMTHHCIHYFSKASLRRLVADSGFRIVAESESDLPGWRTRTVAMRKGSADATGIFGNGGDVFLERYGTFLEHVRLAGETLRSAGGPVYGFGGGNLLPNFFYHLGMPDLEAILEDDRAKDGVFYVNVPTPIRFVGSVSGLEGATVMVTALNYERAILARLAELKVGRVIVPLPFI